MQHIRRMLVKYSHNKILLENKLEHLQNLKETCNFGVSGTDYTQLPANSNKIIQLVEVQAVQLAQVQQEIQVLLNDINHVEYLLTEVDTLHKQILELKHVKGYTWDALAKLMQLNINTCRRYEKNACKILSDKLDAQVELNNFNLDFTTKASM